jgi:hypothetical protein
MALDLADILRKSRARRLRTRGLMYLLRRQLDLVVASRERAWALRGLLRFEVRDQHESITRLRTLSRQLLERTRMSARKS